jgi:hypothetical protein
MTPGATRKRVLRRGAAHPTNGAVPAVTAGDLVGLRQAAASLTRMLAASGPNYLVSPLAVAPKPIANIHAVGIGGIVACLKSQSR